MMNETIATLANTTIQEVLNDERIKRLVLDIIEAKHQDTTSPSPPASSSTIDNTIFNRKTNRAAEYKKLYLQETTKKEKWQKNYCVITNVNKAVIEATPYEDLSMILFLTKFSSLNAFNAPVEKLKTKNRNEIAVIRNCTGKPAFAAFYDGVAVYVCHLPFMTKQGKK